MKRLPRPEELAARLYSHTKPVSGIDMARRAGNVVHADAMSAMVEQLVIVLLKRLGGSLDIPISEVDDTRSDLLLLRLNPDRKSFHFEIGKKQ